LKAIVFNWTPPEKLLSPSFLSSGFKVETRLKKRYSRINKQSISNLIDIAVKKQYGI
jgi:hypothetical protein